MTVFVNLAVLILLAALITLLINVVLSGLIFLETRMGSELLTRLKSTLAPNSVEASLLSEYNKKRDKVSLYSFIQSTIVTIVPGLVTVILITTLF